MGENDRIGLVVFSTEAKVIFNLIKMDDVGKAQAITEVEKLVPLDSTNLWDGLYQGLEMIKKEK